MKPILTTLTALAVVLAASTGAEAGKGPMVNIKPITPRVQIRPLRIMPRLPVGTASRLNKKREQPSEAADGGPQPEPPTYPTKRTASYSAVIWQGLSRLTQRARWYCAFSYQGVWRRRLGLCLLGFDKGLASWLKLIKGGRTVPAADSVVELLLKQSLAGN